MNDESANSVPYPIAMNRISGPMLDRIKNNQALLASDVVKLMSEVKAMAESTGPANWKILSCD